MKKIMLSAICGNRIFGAQGIFYLRWDFLAVDVGPLRRCLPPMPRRSSDLAAVKKQVTRRCLLAGAVPTEAEATRLAAAACAVRHLPPVPPGTRRRASPPDGPATSSRSRPVLAGAWQPRRKRHRGSRGRRAGRGHGRARTSKSGDSSTSPGAPGRTPARAEQVQQQTSGRPSTRRETALQRTPRDPAVPLWNYFQDSTEEAEQTSPSPQGRSVSRHSRPSSRRWAPRTQRMRTREVPPREQSSQTFSPRSGAGWASTPQGEERVSPRSSRCCRPTPSGTQPRSASTRCRTRSPCRSRGGRPSVGRRRAAPFADAGAPSAEAAAGYIHRAVATARRARIPKGANDGSVGGSAGSRRSGVAPPAQRAPTVCSAAALGDTRSSGSEIADDELRARFRALYPGEPLQPPASDSQWQ